MKPETRAWIRSPRGQLSLLGAVYLGSVLFSLGCAATRTTLWERTVYEEYDPVPKHLASLTPDQIAVLPVEDRRALYGQIITTGEGIDPRVLARRSEELHGWLRGTIVTGDRDQRRAATALLPHVQGLDDEVQRTAEYALARAERLEDTEWAAIARRVLSEP